MRASAYPSAVSFARVVTGALILDKKCLRGNSQGRISRAVGPRQSLKDFATKQTDAPVPSNASTALCTQANGMPNQ
jgi:hypothetical protein